MLVAKLSTESGRSCLSVQLTPYSAAYSGLEKSVPIREGDIPVLLTGAGFIGEEQVPISAIQYLGMQSALGSLDRAGGLHLLR